jgi:hypothetical protein
MSETNLENLKNLVSQELENLVTQSKQAIGEVKRVALSQAWKVLQLVVANVIQKIEANGQGLAGKDKKTIALQFLSQFYDKTFIIIDIPFVPTLIEPIIHNSVKSILMVLVGATIDAMVITFKNVGVFSNESKIINQ